MTRYADRAALIVLMLGLAAIVKSQTVAVTGMVVDSSNSSPIPGVTVSLVEYPEITATSATDGTFALSGSVARLQAPSSGAKRPVISLAGNHLTIEASTLAEPVRVEAFDNRGARLYHAEKHANGSGQVRFAGFQDLKGIYFLHVKAGPRDYRFTVNHDLGTLPAILSSQSPVYGLAKVTGTVTLRLAAPTYTTRTITLAGPSIDAGTIKLAKSREPTGVWTRVTPDGADLGTFGLGFVVVDPARPNYIYCAGGNGLYRSSDYGKTFSKINRAGGIYSVAIANSSPTSEPTLWAPSGLNNGTVLKSTDGGFNWRTTGGGLAYDQYSIQVDPYDDDHLISGLHEADGIVESTDGGETWRSAGTSAGMSSGASWYPFFINTGKAATTRTRWLAVPQPGSTGIWLTTDGGGAWTKVLPNDHPHGNCQIHQADGVVYLAVESLWGPVYSPGGVYRSTDLGATWTNVTGATDEAIVWGTPARLYTMYGWAAGALGDFSPNFRVASQPGTGPWAKVATPAGMTQGPSSMAVTYDGTRFVFIGSMWLAGLWRYVEPEGNIR